MFNFAKRRVEELNLGDTTLLDRSGSVGKDAFLLDDDEVTMKL